MGAAAVIALLAGAGFWRLSSLSEPGPTVQGAGPSPAVPSTEAPVSQREQAERVPASAKAEGERADAEPTSLARFAANALVPLTPEEQALLQEEEDVEDLGALIARIERDFRQATTPEEREAKERRYLAAMNLAAKLVPTETPGPDTRAREAQARFLRALEAERAKWVGLAPDEQLRRQDAFKEEFFRNEGERK
jgi:hypothetical protein